MPALAELYAFDALIQNADRIASNANCLVKGDDLRFFDHDQAFGFLLDIFGSRPVADVETYAFMGRHLARPHLRRDRAQFARLENAWQGVTDETVGAYRDLLPDSWSGKQTNFPRIAAHLNGIRADLASVLDAITLSLPSS